MLYDFYEREFGVSVMNFEERLRAVSADAHTASILGCPVNTPVLEIERTGFTYENRPVELRVSLCETRSHYYLHPRR